MIFNSMRRHSLRKIKSLYGFSLTEVLVASFILMIIFTVVVKSHLDSVITIDRSGQRNAIQAAIAEDLNDLRYDANRWQCVEGTSCTGLTTDQDTPMRFQTDHCHQDNPLDLFPVSNKQLQVGYKDLMIERTVEVDTSKNQLNVYYSSNADGQTIESSSAIVPEALKWCG